MSRTFGGLDASHASRTVIPSKDWHIQSDGGALRCFLDADLSDDTGETATEILDVAPAGGRAVIFQSRKLLHAVQPTWRSRFAMTAWIFSEDILADEEISELCVGSVGGWGIASEEISVVR